MVAEYSEMATWVNIDIDAVSHCHCLAYALVPLLPTISLQNSDSSQAVQCDLTTVLFSFQVVRLTRQGWLFEMSEHERDIGRSDPTNATGLIQRCGLDLSQLLPCFGAQALNRVIGKTDRNLLR